MNRLEAIQLITGCLSDQDIIVHANGAISRESYFSKTRKRNFYLLGSMGLASSVGLGIALNQPDHKVIILDGDGNILMGLGNLAMIGALKPDNLTHIILDNEVYGTTGNQPTLSPKLDLADMARSSGYNTSHLITSNSDFKEIFSKIMKLAGPHFIQIKVNTRIAEKCPRLPFTAEQNKKRFMDSILNLP